VASDCGPEIADAAFPVEIYFPVKEGLCACSVFLICCRLYPIQPIRGIMEACGGGPGTCHPEPFQVAVRRGPDKVEGNKTVTKCKGS
jgi:hypothetical protein